MDNPIPGLTGPANPAAPTAAPGWLHKAWKLVTGGAEVAESVATIGYFTGIFKRDQHGKPKLNGDLVRAQAPHFAKDRHAEAQFSILMEELSPGEQTALDQYFLPSLSEDQQADFKLSTLEMTWGETDEQKQKGREAAIKFLKRIAAISDNMLRIEVADARDFIKGDPTEYGWYMVRQFARRAAAWFRDPAGFPARYAQFTNWMENEGTARIIEFRNRLGVTVQPVPGAAVPLLPVAPPGRFRRVANAVDNPFSLSRAARRFK